MPKSLRAGLVTAFALMFVAAALAPFARAAADVRPFVLFWNGKRALVRPISISYTGDGTGNLVRLKWKNFGGPTASATGIDQVNDCTPDCANGSWHNLAGRVTLIAPIACHGSTIYSAVRIVHPTSRETSGPLPALRRC
jgi:hypothetical protein